MLAIALLAAASLELEISGGGAVPLDPEFGTGPTSIALQARAGVDFADYVTISAALFGVAGPDAPSAGLCGGDCRGQASFRALSGLAIVRLHTPGERQAFVEAGLGVGQLSTLSADQLFENPAEHGGTGLSLWLGGGVRWFVNKNLALGLTAGWTNWSNISRPAFTYGATDIPATSTLKASTLLLLVSLGWRAN